MKKNLALFVAAGAAMSSSSVALAQPYSVNVFGATLLANVLRSNAMGNDYIDVDQDGLSTRSVPLNVDRQFLTPLPAAAPATPYLPGGRWIVTYRAIGSVNGLESLVYWGGRGNGSTVSTPFGPVTFNNYANGTDTNANINVNDELTNTFMNQSANPTVVNGNTMIGTGATIGWASTQANPAFVPFRTQLPAGGINASGGTFLATPWLGASVSGTGGVRNDVAPIDVAALWGVAQPGVAEALDQPAQAGYGGNTRRPTTGDGTVILGSNRLVDLQFGLKIYGQDATIDQPSEANDRTIFDTQIGWAPIAPIVNYGVGLQSTTFTDLQSLFTTGRRGNGENLIAITREVGSGTHNGMMNSIGIDPSWGIGENIGPIGNTNSPNPGVNLSGPAYIPGNKLATDDSRFTIRQGPRLGVAYVGVDSWNAAVRVAADILGVQNNLAGRTGTPNVRPTISNVLDNGNIGDAGLGTDTSAKTSDGWRIGGKAVLSTIGNPRMAPAARGGYGWPQFVRSIGQTTTLPDDFNPGFPASATMDNVEAAAFVNNISLSLAAASTGQPESVGSPGEFALTLILPLTGVDYLPTNTGISYAQNLISNDLPGFSQAVQETFRTGTNFYNSTAAALANFNASTNGVNSTRQTGFTYSDGVSGSSLFFLAQDGTTQLGYNAATTAANKIMGDFNFDGVRSTADAAGLIAAWRQRNSGPAWVVPNPSQTSIELLGDFTGDGNFGRVNGQPDRADIRYWADGLALVAGNLDRKAGFTAVDNAFGGNFFGTTQVRGTYVNGNSRADIAGPARVDGDPLTPAIEPVRKVTRGHIPTGFDGTINAEDINYVSEQLNTSSDRNIVWGVDINEAARADLSADINGDLVINCADISEIVVTILGTQLTDLNLDGTTDAADQAICAANQGATNAVWAQGDINCDGIVNAADLAAFGGGGPTCDGIDFNGDGIENDPTDIEAFLSVYSGGACVPPEATCGDIDFNNDGIENDPTDIEAFLSVYSGGPCF